MRLNIVITYERLIFEPEIQSLELSTRILRTRKLKSLNSQLKIFELATRNLLIRKPNSFEFSNKLPFPFELSASYNLMQYTFVSLRSNPSEM